MRILMRHLQAGVHLHTTEGLPQAGPGAPSEPPVPLPATRRPLRTPCASPCHQVPPYNPLCLSLTLGAPSAHPKGATAKSAQSSQCISRRENHPSLTGQGEAALHTGWSEGANISGARVSPPIFSVSGNRMAAATALPHLCVCCVHGQEGKRDPGSMVLLTRRGLVLASLRRVSTSQAALSISAMTSGASEQHWQADGSAGAGARTEDTRDPAVMPMECMEAGQGVFLGGTLSK